MKKIWIGIFMCLYALSSFAQQTDTTFTTITQEEGVMEKQHFIDRYDYVFRTKQASNWMFTVNAASLLTSNATELRLGVERKLSPAFSVQVEAGRAQSSTFTYWGGSQVSRLSIEPRWYFNMAKRMREGKSANNMSGNYIGLEYNYLWNQRRDEVSSTEYSNRQQDIALRIGMQRRLFRYGYVDISTGVGVRRTDSKPAAYGRKQDDIFLNSSIALGFALSSPNKKQEVNNGYCDVLSCFREERSMFKINLYNILKIEDAHKGEVNLRLAWEHKLGASPFSVQLAGNAKAARNNYNYSEVFSYDSKVLNVGGNLQLRYYYNQNRNIARGKSGNNLSGAYFALEGGLTSSNFHQKGWTNDGNGGRNYFDNKGKRLDGELDLLWGIQYRIFKHGYIDFQLGGSATRSINPSVEKWEFGATSRIGVGLSF